MSAVPQSHRARAHENEPSIENDEPMSPRKARRVHEPQRDTSAWAVKCGSRAVGIRNPIREIMDVITAGDKGNREKKLISLAQGDPSAYPHLRPHATMVDTIVSTVTGGEANGYQPSQGNAMCREAVAEAFTVSSRPLLTAADVFMTIGCSEALSHCIATLAAPNSNMLLPRPGFPLYQVLCDYHGVEVRYYDLLPDKDWEIDITSVEKLIDANTSAFLVNNPSNPCGAVFSRSHLEDVFRLAETRRIPIIADEVYCDINFGVPYIACAAVNPRVPVLSVCALSKRWLAPGWRVGWITVHDSDGALAAGGVPATLLKLCQVSLGPSAPLQAAVPGILRDTPKEWIKSVLADLERSALCCVRRCGSIPGLHLAAEPRGAMYLMVKIIPGVLRGIDDDTTFAAALLEEESVVVLPGKCFEAPGYFRVVFAACQSTLEEAWDRVEAFCKRRAGSLAA
jgi:tyrosine aminotransferase